MENFQGRLIGPYQRDGVKWMVQRENTDPLRGGFLCDEMGLGKTVQTIATILICGGSSLIVAPRSVVAQWKSEIKKFAPILKVQVWDRSDELEDVDVVITSYSMTVPRKVDGQRAESTPLHNKRWQRVILDEGHEIRNRNTQQHKSAVKLRAMSRWILSGTPVFNSMKDFVTLCQFMGAEKTDVQRRYDWYRDTLVLRRTKESVCQFNERLRLPPCDFQNVELDMYPEEKEIYTQVFQESQAVVSGLANTQINQQMMYIMECMLRCRQVMIWPQMYYDGIAKKEQTEDPQVWTGRSKKMETLLSMIDEHRNEASLVFCQFMGEMDYLQEELQKREITVHRIDGRSTKDEREDIIKSFRQDSKYWAPVLLIQIKAGGVGLNLQEATRVYITSPAWNPATELQAIGRAHRTGQTKNVVIRKLVYNGEEGLPSIEESIMELQGHKAVVCGEVLNDQTFAEKLPKTVKSRMTVRDLKRIFAQ